MNGVPRPASGELPALAPALQQAVEQRIARGEQSLLLLNRRGYAPVLYLRRLRLEERLPALQRLARLPQGRPHAALPPLRLQRARAARLPGLRQPGHRAHRPRHRAAGRADRLAAARLPAWHASTPTARARKGALQARLTAVHAGEVDVLVGTQMIAKGHDFRGVTLVAAVNPDAALFASDFRAAERLFALLMQAGGRAGRDAEQAARSEMWIQTWHPQHALYAALRTHDFDAFARSQLQERRAAGLPPFSHLALLRAEARQADTAMAFLRQASALAAPLAHELEVRLYPPVPPPVSRVADVERLQMLVESARARPCSACWPRGCRSCRR